MSNYLPPVISQGSSLLVSIQDDLTDKRWRQLSDELMHRSIEEDTDVAIIDLTGVSVMDSFAVRMIGDMSAMLELRGVSTVVVGIHPDVAYSMVQLGLELNGTHTALDLEEGLRLAERLQTNRG